MDAPPIRPGEVVGGAPERADASLVFIGRIRTPFHAREDCGRYASASEVIRDALREWEIAQARREQELLALRKHSA